MLQIRRRHRVFGVGRFVPLVADNDSVLAFLRVVTADDPDAGEPETVLCVNNLSSSPQGATIQMPDHAGAKLEDLFGGGGFPPVGDDGRLTVTLGSRDFFWFRVTMP
jgi:maltose alpha-D-glucosyltransferase/alpha-amylase